MGPAFDDRKLSAQAKAGDKEAYRLLVERYQERAYRLAFQVLRSQSDAEDVVQEAFVKAYLSLAKFKGDSRFYTWLYRIVYNMAIDVKRRGSRRSWEAGGLEEDRLRVGREEVVFGDESPSGPQDMLLRKEQARLIKETLGELSEEHRAVFVLREIDGLSYDEMAQVLGVSKGTVMSRLFYARKKLMEKLQDIRPGTEVSAPRVEADWESAGLNISQVKAVKGTGG